MSMCCFWPWGSSVGTHAVNPMSATLILTCTSPPKPTKATKTKTTKFHEPRISEFQDGLIAGVEISGPAGDPFPGCLWVVNLNDFDVPTYLLVVGAKPTDTSFQSNGLAFVFGTLFRFITPSFALVLSQACPTRFQNLTADLANIVQNCGANPRLSYCAR